MTYECRLTQNYTYGSLSTALAPSDTLVQSPEFAWAVPGGLSTGKYMPITLQDPALKAVEVVWANAHTAGSSVCTMLRGKEGSTARSWPAGTSWVQAPTVRDGQLSVASRAGLPTDPHVGLRAYLRDEQQVVTWSVGAGWTGASNLVWQQTQVPLIDTASVTFFNIPSTLKSVHICFTVRLMASAFLDVLQVQINGDTSSTNAWVSQEILGATESRTYSSATNAGRIGNVAANSQGAQVWSAGEMRLSGWNTPGGRPGANWVSRQNWHDSGSNSLTYLTWSGGRLPTAGPYTSVRLFGYNSSIKSGSEFTAYGYF